MKLPFVPVVQLGSRDASKPKADSLARLEKIWNMDIELRTFPACVEKLLLPSFHAAKEGAAIRPLAMLPPLAKGSTSSKFCKNLFFFCNISDLCGM